MFFLMGWGCIFVAGGIWFDLARIGINFGVSMIGV